MRKGFHSLLILIAVVVISCNPSASSGQDSGNQELTTLVLVRHAEKMKEGDDPSLTAKGRVRAEALVKLLGSSGISAIYSTPFKRNMETVKPLASALGVEVQTYDPRKSPDVFLGEIREKHGGGIVLICGHSNTVPAMLNNLTASGKYSQFDEGRYDDVFVVSYTEPGNARVLNLLIQPETY